MKKLILVGIIAIFVVPLTQYPLDFVYYALGMSEDVYLGLFLFTLLIGALISGISMDLLVRRNQSFQIRFWVTLVALFITLALIKDYVISNNLIEPAEGAYADTTDDFNIFKILLVMTIVATGGFFLGNSIKQQTKKETEPVN